VFFALSTLNAHASQAGSAAYRTYLNAGSSLCTARNDAVPASRLLISTDVSTPSTRIKNIVYDDVVFF
jgi:hypothetical protein